MGLQVKSRSPIKARTTATLMTIMSVFAFVLSPFYGIVADQVAGAAGGNIIVRPGSLNGWSKDSASSDFSAEQARIGAGSFKFKFDSAKQKNLKTGQYKNVKLSDIDSLSYSSYVSGETPSNVLRTSIRIATRLGNTSTELVFEPTYTTAYRVTPKDSWQDLDAVSAGAVWYSTKKVTGFTEGGDVVANMFTWSQLTSAFPDAKVSSNIALNIGQNSYSAPWLGFVGYVDNVRINDAIYDFEGPVNPTVTGDNFNTHDGADYKGINVGFNINDDFGTVTDIKVDLYKDGDILSTNTSNTNLHSLINDGGEREFSTPFIVTPGAYTEAYWNLGTYDWKMGDKPTKAVVTVTGTNGTQETTLTPLIEPKGWSFESLVTPQAPTGLKTIDDTTHNDVTNGYMKTLTATNTVTNSWDAVDGAVKYNYRFYNQRGDEWQAAFNAPVTSKTGKVNWNGNAADGLYYFEVQSVGANGLTSEWTRSGFTVDTTAPDAPVFTSPTNYQWFSTKPTNKWDAVSDLSGIDYYQLKYVYDDGHTFNGTLCDGVKACREVPGDQTSRLHDLGDDEEGLVRAWVRAVDNAGNVSPWSAPVYYYYDHTAPVVKTSNIHNGDVVNTGRDGKLAVQGEFTDNSGTASNYANIQLVRTGYSQVKTIYGQNPAGSTLATFDNVVSGDYTLYLTATDLAGHVVKKQVNFTVDNKAVVTGDYFSAKSDGLNVGFHVSNLKDNADKVEVALYGAGGGLITKNVGDSAQMLALLNGSSDVSSPFWMPLQGDADDWWTFGQPDWRRVNKPSHAVVTVYYNNGETSKSQDIPFDSPSDTGETWEALVASLPVNEDNGAKGDATGKSKNKNTDSRDRTVRKLRSTVNSGDVLAALTPPAPVFGTDSNVLGDADETEGEVKASEDREAAGVSGDATKKGCSKLLGLCWYYWIPVVIAVAAIVWWLSSRKRDNEALV